jgi:hypothetical protein
MIFKNCDKMRNQEEWLIKNLDIENSLIKIQKRKWKFLMDLNLNQ